MQATLLKRIPIVFKTGFLLWFVIFGLYASSAARTIVGFGDSDELLTAGYTWSIAHPPGYSFLVTMLRGVMHLPGLNPAHWAHVLGSLIQSLAMVILYLIGVKTIIHRYKTIISAVFTFMVATTNLVWEHGLYVEVFALNIVWSLLLVYSTLQVRENSRFLWIWGLVAGFGLAHHQTFVLVLLPLAIYLFQRLKNQFLFRAAPALIASFVGNQVLIFGMAFTHNPLSWRFIPSLEGWWNFYTRQDFSGFVPEVGNVSAWWKGFDLSLSIESCRHYLVEVSRHLHIVLLFGLLGLAKGKKFLNDLYVPLLVIFTPPSPHCT